jgi:hypothetical protein
MLRLCKQTSIIYPIRIKKISMSLFVIFGAAFLAWLMWSSKGQKESFLSFAWIAMVVIGVLDLLYRMLA